MLNWTQSHPHDEPRDLHADLRGPLWAEVGPDERGGWSWSILNFDRGNEVVAGGFAASEDDAKAAVVAWAGENNA